MANGKEVAVQNLVPGDHVLMFDVYSAIESSAILVSLRITIVDNMLTIHTQQGSPLIVDANPRLKFYVWSSNGPLTKAVTEFQPGDLLYSYDLGTWVPITQVKVSYGGSHQYYDLLTNPYLNTDGRYLSFIANGYADPCTPFCKEGPTP